MLPIQRVVLFKHGVGHFHRSGTVEGDELIELSFKEDQMNDVLKSLTALDYGGGSFAALSYDSEESMERRLGELNMSIPEKGAASSFLDLIKGARVALPRPDGEIEGAVMGIETVERFVEHTRVKDSHLVILTDDHRMVRVPLLDVETIRFLDEPIRRDLKTLLDTLFSGLRKDRKSISIQARGKGSREVSLSYVIEAPVWKTSYRIMLPDELETRRPLLQGWALVDNTTEDDWEGVRLSLVSGLPISFVHDLYTPRYRKRPVVEVEDEAAVAPPIVEGARVRESSDREASIMHESMETAVQSFGRLELGVSAASHARPRPSMAEAALESVEVETRTREVGDLFAYEILQPVDIARSHSALVPIVQTEVDVERVALYNEEIRERNPMTAFRFRNTTNLTLEGGPVTVFEGPTYVGEAMLDTLRKDEERITPYSVELGITVSKDDRIEREAFRRVRKRGSYIHKLYRQMLVTSYEFSSRLDRAVTVYLDHPYRYERSDETPEPAELTESYWRFKLEARPRATTSFEVREVSEEYESVEIPTIARKEILRLASDKLISDTVKASLEKIADQAEKIEKTREDIERNEAEATEIGRGQKRIRDNLGALGNSVEERGLRKRYVATLAQEEEHLDEIRKAISDLRGKLERERNALAKSVDALRLRE